MIKFINHDCLAHGWFNRDEQLANSSQAAWHDILVNSTDSLTLLCERLSADFLSINQKLRKPWSSATVDTRMHTKVFLRKLPILSAN